MLVIIILFQGIYFFADFSTGDKTNLPTNEIAIFQKEIDSLKLVEIENRKPKIYPFNPSFITDYKGYQLGMSTEEIDRLLLHRSKDKYINSTKHFQEVTGVSDSLLAVISPNFKFPEWISNQKKSTYKKDTYIGRKTILLSERTDLNFATSEQLMIVNGIGPALSERIVKYRNSLNGFVFDDQLNEVYGLEPDVISRILERFTVLSKPTIEKLNVNTATFKEVLHLPYIDYELTKKIFQYRDEVAELQTIEELKNIEDFPIEKFDKIIVYLKAE